jgi:Ca-activated chloride channel homolog
MSRLLLALVAFVFGLASALVGAATAEADGFLVPTRPERRVRGDWSVTYHKVDVTVVGQKAHVRVDQEFTNLSHATLEAEYVFPVPPGAMVNAVTLMVDGKGMEGRLLRAEEARRIYDDIVRRQKDPALVEYVGRDFFRASIFPIPPGGARQLVLEYDQLLPKDGSTVELVYPLNTEKFSARPLRDVRVAVDVTSETGVGPVYCPSHDVVVTRSGEKRARAVFESKDVRPATDFLLYWGESSQAVSATLLTHWPRGEDRGYFLLLAEPTLADEAQARKPKDLTLCVDVSGSMAGVVFEQTRAALRQVVGGLSPDDVFNVITYSSGVVPLWDATRKATRENLKEALDFVESLRPNGGTNIDGALKAALAQPGTPGLPRVLLFLTDGRPTMGETTNPDEIEKRVRQWNERGAVRIFTFGVGTTVNGALLDRIALGNHGVPVYVRPGEDVERKVAALYDKIRHPVLTDVRVDFGGMQVSEVLPGVAPDLFRGGQLVLAGRFKRGGGPVDVVVSGRDGDHGREFHYKLTAGGEGQGLRDDFPARVWAVRRIAELVDQIRIAGRREPELVDEIVRLSTKFGIMTEYTSFLADETADHGRFDRNRDIASRSLSRAQEGASKDDAAGFAWAANQGERRGADKAPPAAASTPRAATGSPADAPPPPTTPSTPPTADGGRTLWKEKEGGRDVEELKVGVVRQVANRAFYKRANVQKKAEVWVDAAVVDAEKADEVVARWSPRFFELLSTTSPDENARLAQDGDVLLRVAGKQILVTDAIAMK